MRSARHSSLQAISDYRIIWQKGTHMNLLDKDTALTEIKPLHYHLTVSGNWSISGIPNGG
jgi:hypothetical protein